MNKAMKVMKLTKGATAYDATYAHKNLWSPQFACDSTSLTTKIGIVETNSAADGAIFVGVVREATRDAVQ